jgi:hypothetical protein
MTRRDRATTDLFDWRPPKVAAGFAPEQLPGGRTASRISRALSLAMRDCGKPRAEVAAAMTAELGYAVSADMLDAYASEAKEGHRISLERFIALIAATGCTDLIGLVTEPFGLVAVPARYEALIELNLIEEHEMEVARRKDAAAARWKAGR